MNTKLKCLLLDDELPGLTYLKILCEQIPELEVVKAFNRAELFLQEMLLLDFDICILDIEMPDMNGLDIANLLNGKPVIFTTAYKEYAVEAFDLDAIDYICKPVKRERLVQAVQKAIKRLENTQPPKKFIQLNTDKGKSLLFFDQLSYITIAEMDSRDKQAFLKDGTSLLLKNISYEKLIELLPLDQFCRINKKELIALNAVQFFSYDEITTNMHDLDGKNLIFVLSDAYRNDFIKKIKI